MAFQRIRFCLLCVMFAATTAVAEDHLSGLYKGRIGDTTAILSLRVAGSEVSGQITRSGENKIELAGTFSEGKIVGAASTSGGVSFFEAHREFGSLVIIIFETGTVTGQAIAVRAEFAPTDGNTYEEQHDSIAVQRDPKLTGVWTTRGLVARGDIVLPATIKMTLGPDGGYFEITEPARDLKRGEWRSRSGFLEYRPRVGDAWTVLGEYRSHGDNLITILPDQEPRVWTRGD